jgi:predicted dehydrogenase
MALKVGLIGCGIVSGYGHLPAIHASSEWELHAIADIKPEALASARQRYAPAHAFADYRDLLALPDLDAVVVATHADTHAEITIAAARRGLHVLCEKPMARGEQQCRAMVDAARRAGVLLAINFNSRCVGMYRKIKGLIDSGALGKVRVIRIALIWSAHQWQPPERLEKFMQEGGPVIDSAVHFFEAVRWFTGADFERIDTAGAIITPYEHPQHVIAACRLTDGSIALIEAGWIYCKHTKTDDSLYQMDVIGDDGTVSWHSQSNTFRVYLGDSTEVTQFQDPGKDFETVYALFAESIRRGELVDLASGEDGLAATAAAFRALAATKG